MDEYDFYDDCDRFERDDDYNVFEERQLIEDAMMGEYHDAYDPYEDDGYHYDAEMWSASE
ncbi:MAG: hypothetical protein EBR05_09075 [Marivivens sp.]|nr:hypothetical protein [Marivivens sp.]NBT52093.1 hypothetical protein [Marivivens sp.]NBX09940.1 hypothetical protein [Marivivens sp.]NCW69055.1 hypothetical protein [Marivivens sp.]NDH03189.1 hypothetical protein [Marivivens sp.]